MPMPDTTTAELERQLALARREIEAMQRVSAALYSVTDLEELQRLALQTALDVVEADAGSLLVHDPASNTLIFRHVVGPVAETLLGTTLDLNLGRGVAGGVFLSGLPRITNDVDKDSDHIGAVDARTGYQTRSLMTVPLKRRDGASLGVLQLVNKRAGAFDAADIATLEVMGSLVVMALENARLAQEARLAAVARSVGEISHDIGNMLTSVLPYVQTLALYMDDARAGKEGAWEALDSFYAEVLENVADGVHQVEERAKEVARAVKGEVAPLLFETGRPFHAATRVTRSLAAYAEKRGVTLRVAGDDALQAVYDRSRLYNALYNLVNNAIAETPPEGTITLTVAADTGDCFTVAVSDTGAGMTENVRQSLFTDAARSTKPGGTGMGTRIVRRIVEQHGGTVSVQSAPGAGTTITLRLPLQPPLLQSLS